MFANIIRNHAERYPKMQIQDIYKLAHQAAMGSEHHFIDPRTMIKNLNEEINQLSDLSSNEPMIDPISPDGEIVRVHLRPFLRSNEDISLLADAFQVTASSYRGQTKNLKVFWENTIDTNLFPSNLMNKFFKKMEEMNFPAVHHSEPYRLAYQPAYRVIWKKFLPTNLQGGK